MVFIIADGREKMNKSMVEFLEKDLKVWDSGMLLPEHRNNEVTCHLFEKTIDLPKHSSQREYYKPLQIALAVKEKNGGKLNSHLWYFSAFVKQLQPDYCVVRAITPSPCNTHDDSLQPRRVVNGLYRARASNSPGHLLTVCVWFHSCWMSARPHFPERFTSSITRCRRIHRSAVSAEKSPCETRACTT